MQQQQQQQQQQGRRRRAVDIAKVEQCQIMAKEIVNLYASLISGHFTLNEDFTTLQKSTDAQENGNDVIDKNSAPDVKLFPFVPPNANCVTASFYLTRITIELGKCVNDINTINLAGETFSELKVLMENAKWRFVEILCERWTKGE